MRNFSLRPLAGLFLAFSLTFLTFSAALAATISERLFAIRANGDLLQVDHETGGSILLGSAGFFVNNLASNSRGELYTLTGLEELYRIDPDTGQASFVNRVTFPLGQGIIAATGLAFDSMDNMYAVGPTVTVGSPLSRPDALVKIDIESGQATHVGSLGLSRVIDLAFDPNDNLFCVAAGGLCSVDTETGSAERIGTLQPPQGLALEFSSDGTLFAAMFDLVTLDPSTGVATTVGNLVSDSPSVRGLATTTPVPLPAALTLFAVALASFAPWLHRKRTTGHRDSSTQIAGGWGRPTAS